MSGNFHVNAKGEPGKCSAVKGGCPFGGEDSHYPSPEEVRVAYEKKNNLKLLHTKKKRNSSYLEVTIDNFSQSKEQNYGRAGRNMSIKTESSNWVGSINNGSYAFSGNNDKPSGYLSYYKNGVKLAEPTFHNTPEEAKIAALDFDTDSKNFKNGEFEVAKKVDEYGDGYGIIDDETGTIMGTGVVFVKAPDDDRTMDAIIEYPKDAYEYQAANGGRSFRVLATGREFNEGSGEYLAIELDTGAIVSPKNLRLVNLNGISEQKRERMLKNASVARTFGLKNGAEIG